MEAIKVVATAHTVRVKIYVPTRDKKDAILASIDVRKYVERAQALFTACNVQTVNDANFANNEICVTVESFLTVSEAREAEAKILSFLQDMKRELYQNYIALEINNAMYTI
tara:strand:+ start:9171 stop:9503 length:333 start_codon:yes stop_codon:yes gene_type:complete